MADPIIDKLKDVLGQTISEKLVRGDYGLINNQQVQNYALLSIAQNLAEIADLS